MNAVEQGLHSKKETAAWISESIKSIARMTLKTTTLALSEAKKRTNLASALFLVGAVLTSYGLYTLGANHSPRLGASLTLTGMVCLGIGGLKNVFDGYSKK